MDDYTPEPEPLFGEQPPLTLGSRIGSSLRDGASSSSSSSQWRPLDLIFSPPGRSLEIHSPPPPPAPSTRPHSSLLSLVSGRNFVARQPPLIRRPASASSLAYLRPRHRTDFEAQTQRLRDRARARDLLDYVRGPVRNPDGSAVASGTQATPESFARRESGPRSDDESDPRPTSLPLSLSLPPAPVPAHAHPHSGGSSHSALRRVTSELSSLDRTIEAHRRELSAAREDFAARFRRGVSSLAPIDHRSPSPIALAGSSSSAGSAGVVHPQPRESLRAALWGTGPSEDDGLPTPRSLTPESGERGFDA
jgi:hypothetical protein